MFNIFQIKLFIFFAFAMNYSSLTFASSEKPFSSSTLYKETLPKVLCQDDQYFVHCFTGAKKNCKTDIVELADKCFELNLEAFKKIKKEMSEDRAQLAENIKMGYCIGVEYEKKNISNKKDEPKCYSQKNW